MSRQASRPAGEGGVIDLTFESSDEGNDDDDADETYFRQPGAGSTSHAADDSTRAPSETELRARLDGFDGSETWRGSADGLAGPGAEASGEHRFDEIGGRGAKGIWTPLQGGADWRGERGGVGTFSAEANRV